jgi:hypothetical protein
VSYVATAVVAPGNDRDVLAFAIGHREPNRYVVDLVREAPSVATVLELLQQYRIEHATRVVDDGTGRELGLAVLKLQLGGEMNG